MYRWTVLALCPLLLLAQEAPVIKIAKRPHAVVADYLELHHAFEKQVCPAGTEQEFQALFRAYRGSGHYVPLLEDDTLDQKTIKKFLPELKAKKAWLDGLVAQVENTPDFKAQLQSAKGVESQLQAALAVKEAFHEARSPEKKKELAQSGRKAMEGLETAFKALSQSVPFLLGHKFPVDHLELRARYDRQKYEKGEKARIRANETYFERKLVEDGAQNPDTTRPDVYLRAAINTVAVRLAAKDRPDLIDENLRFDLAWVLRSIQQHLADGKDRQVERLKEWQARTERAIVFYEGLLSGKSIVDGKMATNKDYLESLSQARYNLKKFVQDRQVKAYGFWSAQDELMQALFAMETILYNEAGQLDGREALERKDIAQVIINRRYNPKYTTFEEGDDFLRALSAQVQAGTYQNHFWINLLFKEGEFSFTYFFIPSTLRVFCPEQTNTGKFLRRENLKIALNALQRPRYAFRAERYFSRGAMLGRIDMAPIWDEYSPLPERPGPKSPKAKKLEAEYRAGRYKYWYHFESDMGKHYKVVEIKSVPYAFAADGKGVFKHRSPHQFRYFENRALARDFASRPKP